MRRTSGGGSLEVGPVVERRSSGEIPIPGRICPEGSYLLKETCNGTFGVGAADHDALGFGGCEVYNGPETGWWFPENPWPSNGPIFLARLCSRLGRSITSLVRSREGTLERNFHVQFIVPRWAPDATKFVDIVRCQCKVPLTAERPSSFAAFTAN